MARAPWTTNGYLKNRDGSEALWRGGYLHTGDIGYLDGDGYLRVTDRLKDVIKSGGEWISSIELEDVVSRCEGVAEAAAIGVPDARWGERPLVLVVPGDPEHPPEDGRDPGRDPGGGGSRADQPVGGAGPHRARRHARQDQRREDRQEAPANALRECLSAGAWSRPPLSAS